MSRSQNSPWLPESVRLTHEQGTSYSKGRQSSRSDFDLCSPDGFITKATRTDRSNMQIEVSIEKIHEQFRGFIAAPESVTFNLKSSLTQLGVDCTTISIKIDQPTLSAQVTANLFAITPLAILTLDYVGARSFIGKLFCAESCRVIRPLEYVERLEHTVDLKGHPLLVYGRTHEDGSHDPEWELKQVDGRIVAFLPVMKGVVTYSGEVHGLLPTVGSALKSDTPYKNLLRLHQEFHEDRTRVATPSSLLMVRTFPMHMRTMFARVVTSLLPKGLKCSSSNIIEPTEGSSRVSASRTFVFHGESTEELTSIPIEFFSLEAYREHVRFEDRKSLPSRCALTSDVLKVFKTMPPSASTCATFVCKGGMFDAISEREWVVSDPKKEPYVGNEDPARQQELAQNYLYQQCEYGILSAISIGEINSDGALFTKCFPSPILKSLLLTRQVVKRVRALFFVKPSKTFGSFFRQDDAAMMRDLNTFGISIFFVDEAAGILYQFMLKVGHSSGMFVPLERRLEYLNATSLGVYGSNLVAGNFEAELHFVLANILQLRKTCTHPLLNPNKPLSLVTGGGPGAMEVGNRVAKSLGILSCGMFVDFGSLSNKPGATINEQKKNPYVEAFMTYRPDKLVERQSDFNLDLPIFLTGGIGTDFEYALEEVRRKVGSVAINPLILFGTEEHWGHKISGRYKENLQSGTIKGSEWMSNVPWIVRNGQEAYAVLSRFFSGTLPIGPGHPTNDRGYMVVTEAFMKDCTIPVTKED